jgi:hypothetical protein
MEVGARLAPTVDGASTAEYVRSDKVYVVEKQLVWTKRLGRVVASPQEHPALPDGWVGDPGAFCVVRYNGERQDRKLDVRRMFRASEEDEEGYAGPVFGTSSVNPHATRSWKVGDPFFALEREKESLPLKKLGTVSRVSRWNDDPDKRKYGVEFEDAAMNGYAPYWYEDELEYADVADENDQLAAPQDDGARGWWGW